MPRRRRARKRNVKAKADKYKTFMRKFEKLLRTTFKGHGL